jgi:glucose/arabinose dehydrogenase
MKKTILWAVALCSQIAISQTIALETFATGFTNPVEITHAGDSRLFVLQQEGQIRILNADGTINSTPFLNITAIISSGGERGLLGLAFHPEYDSNGYFYVYYNNANGGTTVARYTRSTADADVADASSVMIILTMQQPEANHNGGCLRFGPDGYLYIAKGDGGGGGDPNNNGQNINSLLGKILRIDVDGAAPYSIPAGNPYAGVEGADEIWAYGLRNPWKFSFNRLNGDIWIADVGQENIEEINKVPGSQAGANYGWRCFEGTAVYNNSGCSLVEMYTPPFAEYTHSATGGCSITGGYVYTGDVYPALQGKYIFADYCNNKLGIVGTDAAITYTEAFTGNFSTFGEDIEGELYVAGKNNGTVYKITDSSVAGTTAFANGLFSMYPNPAKNEVFLNLTTDAATISVYDMGGKLLLTQALAAGDNNINTSGLQAGLYLAQVTHSSGTISQKLVIQ